MDKILKKINIKIIIIGFIIFELALISSLQACVSIAKTNPYISIDVAVWMNMAKKMTEGKIIYKDIFDHKGPVLYFLYFSGYILGKKNGIWFLDFVCNLINFIIIYKICKKLNLDRKKSILIIFVEEIFLSFLYLENPCTESLALPFILLSLYEFIKFVLNNKDFKRKESLITRNMFGHSITT